MFVEDNPDASIDDILMHYGVMGMKWGKHRAKANAADIHAARSRVRSQSAKVKEAQGAAKANPTDKVTVKKAADLKAAFLKNPDRVTAARMTRGEKAVALVIFGVTGGIGVAAVAGTSARSRRIEYKQNKAAGVKP